MGGGFVFDPRIHDRGRKVVLGHVRGRADEDTVTIFKSLGMAVEDVVAARLAFEGATRLGLGQRLDE